jgi:hypothetical protein
VFLLPQSQETCVNDLASFIAPTNMAVPTTDIQQQHQPPTTGSNNEYQRCDDGEENSGANVTMAINNNTNATNIGPLGTEERRQHQQPSSSSTTTPWYDQRLVITFATDAHLNGQPHIPVRPHELQGIPAEMWMEFFEKLTTTVRIGTLSSWLEIEIILMGAGFLALLVLAIMAETGKIFWPMLLLSQFLLLLYHYLRVYKLCMDFDQQHTPGVQAVCRHYSPEFEERTNYCVDFKGYKGGLQFWHEKTRQLNNDDEEIRKQLHLKDVVMPAHAQRRNDDNDAATAHYATLV